VARRIIIDPGILQGKPTIAGTRISVDFILQLLDSGMDAEQIANEYTNPNHDDILAAVEYTRKSMGNEAPA